MAHATTDYTVPEVNEEPNTEQTLTTTHPSRLTRQSSQY